MKKSRPLERSSDKADKLLGLLGLARRAGRLALGFSAVEKMVHRGEKPLVITASDLGGAEIRVELPSRQAGAR